MKVFNSIIENDSEDFTWGTRFKVPEDVVIFFKEKKSSRFICNLNDLVEYPCAFIPRNGLKYINVNKQICKKLGLKLGSEVSITLKEDESEYGMPVPQEIVDLFAHDQEFFSYFHELTPGKQRSLLYMVGKLKGPESRMKKAIVICNHLKRREGNLDYKVLNHDFKEYNNSLKM